MNNCNHMCRQGRDCNCVANEEYASSTEGPKINASTGFPPMPITPEGDEWEEIDDDYEWGFVEVLCGVGALVLICMLICFYWGTK